MFEFANYQLIVDALVKMGNQLNKPAYRFLKGEVIALALEKATDGRLLYVDAEGYDSVDLKTNEKYELKSTFSMFSKKDTITGRVSISNTNKSSFVKTFDHLLCIQSDPKKFAISQLSWEECHSNYVIENGQFNLKKNIPVTKWLCKNETVYKELPQTTLDIRKLIESVLVE